jgi:hypothetical protein
LELKSFLLFIFISENVIGVEGAAELGVAISKLVNLTTLNLEIK